MGLQTQYSPADAETFPTNQIATAHANFFMEISIPLGRCDDKVAVAIALCPLTGRGNVSQSVDLFFSVLSFRGFATLERARSSADELLRAKP